MWFLDQLAPGAPTHNAARAFRLRGRLDVSALERALRELVARHAALRTVVMLEQRQPRQIARESWALELPVTDLGQIPPSEREAVLAETLRQLSRQPFDLARDLMFRSDLFRLDDDEHVLLIRMHHIAGDAASDRILFHELGVCYDAARRGVPVTLPAPLLEYADFAVWQREQLQGERLEELVAHWKRYLDGAPALLKLPIDRPRPEIQRHVGAHREVAYPEQLRRGLAELARAQNATLFMVLLGALATLLYRLTGERDLVIGTPMANRNHVELEQVVGFFSNTVAVRIDLFGSPRFGDVVARTREAVLTALAHQDLPFEQVVESLRVPRGLAWNPVFQVNFRARSEEPPTPALDGVEVEPIPVDIGFSRFDLSLELQPAEQGLGGYVEYDEDLFEPATIEAIADDLGSLLTQIVADPDAEILALRLPSRHG
jgi:Condensation domain